jgi:hypothetical protein
MILNIHLVSVILAANMLACSQADETTSETPLKETPNSEAPTKSDGDLQLAAATAPGVIVGIDGNTDHGQVESGVVDAILECIRTKQKSCVAIIPPRPEYSSPESLCSTLYASETDNGKRVTSITSCVKSLRYCYSTGRCKSVFYNPEIPRSLPDQIRIHTRGGKIKPVVIAHHVPCDDGSNPIWDCPCSPQELGKLNPLWRCCYSKQCAETAGGGTPNTPNPEGPLPVSDLQRPNYKDIDLPGRNPPSRR